SQPKKQTQTAQHAAQPAHAAGGGAVVKKASTATHQVQTNNRSGPAVMAGRNTQKNKKNETSTAVNRERKAKPAQSFNADERQKGKKNQTKTERQTAKAANRGQTANAANAGHVKGAGKPNEAATVSGQNTAKGKLAKNKAVKPQHFNLSK